MAKHRVKTEARGLAVATKRKPSKPKYAYGTVIGPGEVPAPDLRVVELSPTLAVWVRLKLRLSDGCSVLGIGPRGKRKVGRYVAGPPKQFAEFVDTFQGGKTRRRVPLSSLSAIVRVVAVTEGRKP